eukprot:TRINITY_DN32050_c0_g1_i1.p1 TRINITY_DN32050_c0_g1~~TRINITY_DN32050_c0_g1_i1.p1  ORF type:complete len:1053 (-),score=195.73 TRINITY_DN32050_c0_g1_i1:246-3404(-)
MQGIKKLCGGFLGQFQDQHESPPASDDEDAGDEDLYMPRDYKRPVKKNKNRFPFMIRSGEWSQFLTTVMVESRAGTEVTRREFEGIEAVKKNIAPGMMRKLRSMTSIHTVEIISCKLKEQPPLSELHNLVVLRLSKNELTLLSRHMEEEHHKDKTKKKDQQGPEHKLKPYKLETFCCDHNKLEIIEPGVLSGMQVANLLVLNLSHNNLQLLPYDFGAGASNLKFMDLSHNRLFALPESFLDCRKLIALNIDHNEIEQLPQGIGLLRGLRKLFASYNQLSELPTSIGGCKLLEKIRLVSNQIHYMPYSLLELWQAKGGCLDELLVEGNPLIQPSITAFQMGGLERALRLFGEWVRDQRRKQKEAEQQEEQRKKAEADVPSLTDELTHAQEPLPQISDAIVDKEAAAQPAPDIAVNTAKGRPSRMDSTLSLPMTHMLSSASDILSRKGSSLGDIEVNDFQEKTDVDEGGVTFIETSKGNLMSGDSYYFSHVHGDVEGCMNIRNAESILLMRKKHAYLKQLKKAALAFANVRETRPETVPEHLRELFMKDFDETKLTQKVPVQDLDLYFCSLVYGSKSAFTSIHALWDKFEVGEKGYMSLDEWQNLCKRVKTKLPKSVVGQLWDFMTGENPEQLQKHDFVAGWHIHDTEVSDPYLRHQTRVLKLSYYGMGAEELQQRLKLRMADEADLATDLQNRIHSRMQSRSHAHGEHHHQAGFTLDYSLTQGPGERPVQDPESIKHLRERQERRDGINTNAALQPQSALKQSNQGQRAVATLPVQVSIFKADDAPESDVEDVSSLDSFCLSRSAASSEESFDARAAVEEQEEWEKREALMEQRMLYEENQAIIVDSDEALAQLMQLPPAVISQRLGLMENAASSSGSVKSKRDRKKKAKKKKTHKKALTIHDSRFYTDVLAVRRAIREAHRNMPADDFKGMVNYMFKKLKLFKHAANEEGAILYLHADDPCFKNTTGLEHINPYVESLMFTMGFVRLNNIHWVWPARHWDSEKESSIWISHVVPSSCPGKNMRRLHDMIELFKMCKQVIVKEGKDFAGHMRY